MADSINALNGQGMSLQFEKFAQLAASASKGASAVRFLGYDGAATVRDVVVTVSDKVGKIGRSVSVKEANNTTRAIFRQSVAAMFGGEDRIPDAVKAAMKLGDYGKGKPLTARRIIAVNNAIEKLKLKHMVDAFATGSTPDEMMKKAQDAGHTETDFPKLNVGANLLARATGMPLKDAFLAVIDKSGAAYACANFGPLFTGSVVDFKNGLEIVGGLFKLQDEYKTLAAKVVSSRDPKDYAALAASQAQQLKTARQIVEQLFAMQKTVDKTDQGYQALMQQFETAIQKCEEAVQTIEGGSVSDEKALFNLTIGSKAFDSVTQKLGELVRSMHGKCAKGVDDPLKKVVTALGQVSNTCITKGKECGMSAFRDGFVARETPRIAKLLHDAETEGKFKLPKKFFDTLIAKNLYSNMFDGVKTFESMAAKLKTDSSFLLFNKDQKARLEKLVAFYTGNPAAGKLVEAFASDVETSCCKLAYIATQNNAPWDGERIENLVKHFEKYPDAAKGFVVGFKEDRLEDVKADLKNVMTLNFNAAIQRPEFNSGGGIMMTSLKSGLMPQSTREYNRGYVTFNGQNLPDGVTGKKYHCSDTSSRDGFCEFLESRFDDEHVQMRRFVSFVCGMADGFIGAISTGAFTGNMENNPELLKSPTRLSKDYMDCKTMIQADARDARDNYDISIAENGDVTIKLVHYEGNTLAHYTDENDKIVSFDTGAGSSALMATTRIEATMVIKNAADAQLGENIPEFAITDIKQEAVA